jgi:hypothetical protein
MRKKIHLRVVVDDTPHEEKLLPIGNVDKAHMTREVVRDIIAQTILLATFPKAVPSDIEGWRDSARMQSTKIVDELNSRNLLTVSGGQTQ